MVNARMPARWDTAPLDTFSMLLLGLQKAVTFFGAMRMHLDHVKRRQQQGVHDFAAIPLSLL